MSGSSNDPPSSASSIVPSADDARAASSLASSASSLAGPGGAGVAGLGSAAGLYASATGSSGGAFAINQSEVSQASSLISGIAGSGNVLSEALPILDPLVFGVIGSQMGLSNASLEDSVLQCVQGVLNLCANTSGDIDSAVNDYNDLDGGITSSLGNITTDYPEVSLPAFSDDNFGAGTAFSGDVPAFGLGSFPGAGGYGLGSLAGGGAPTFGLGALAEDAGYSGELDSAVLSRLSGEMLEESGELLESDFMKMFRSLSGEPSDVNDRWNGLTDDEQEEALASDRAAVGSMDGIPSEVRNRANTEELDDLIDKAEAKIGNLREAAVQADPDHDDDEAKVVLCLQQAAILGAQLAGLLALRGRLAAVPDAYLLAIGTDPTGTGRYAVAVNNPDTADNIATLVPAIQTGLSEMISDYVTAAANMAAAASEADREQTTSVIIWGDYSVPLFAENGAPPAEPEAAPVLNQFQAGLYAASVSGARLHTAMIGNGPGSILVGEAAKLPQALSADDVIALGSPGFDASATASLSGTTTAAAGGGSQVWLYRGESGDNGPGRPHRRTGMDYLQPDSPVMPDLVNIIVAEYDNIYKLAKQ